MNQSGRNPSKKFVKLNHQNQVYGFSQRLSLLFHFAFLKITLQKMHYEQEIEFFKNLITENNSFAAVLSNQLNVCTRC